MTLSTRRVFDKVSFVFLVWLDDSTNRVNANVVIVVVSAVLSWFCCPLSTIVISLSFLVAGCSFSAYTIGPVSLGREGIVSWLLHLHSPPAEQTKKLLIPFSMADNE
jgi:hypothetical protein